MGYFPTKALRRMPSLAGTAPTGKGPTCVRPLRLSGESILRDPKRVLQVEQSETYWNLQGILRNALEIPGIWLFHPSGGEIPQPCMGVFPTTDSHTSCLASPTCPPTGKGSTCVRPSRLSSKSILRYPWALSFFVRGVTTDLFTGFSRSRHLFLLAIYRPKLYTILKPGVMCPFG